MNKITSPEDLLKIKNDYAERMKLREEAQEVTPAKVSGLNTGTKRIQILCCSSVCCLSSKSGEIADRFCQLAKEQNVADRVDVIRTGCFGFCEKGPNVKIVPDNTFYTEVKPDDADEIFKTHILGGKRVDRLLFEDPKTHKRIPDSKDMNFYRKQMRVALRNCCFIDPEDIKEYIARDGYMSLANCLKKMTPKEVIEIVKKSGLRGRGGAGFPTGMKWEFASKSVSDVKYVVCNADEGDPGAFMDRSIMEGDPNSIIEAMAICGYAIGSENGLVYIRAEYPLAVKRLKIAREQARKLGLLGKNIFGSKFSFDIDIRYGAGAFVCGEETALIHSMEGKRGEPTLKPPFPAEAGYKGKPTNVNNVETLANVPIIINKGAEWFASIGSEKSKGTKVFALAGKINNVGLIEVPMGITLREVIYEIGGGIKDGKKFKAVQTGGPSGGCLTEKHLDTPIDFDNLLAAGSMMGSGGMIVMDEDDCMVSVAKFYLEFTVEESCGKCAPCRVGNKRLHEMLEKITSGKGVPEDIEYLKNLSTVIKDTALCGLGQTSPNPVLSTIDNFWDEYVAHVVDHKCPAGQCKALKKYIIDPEKCIGCTACARVCPTNAIRGTVKMTHENNQELCYTCGSCYEKCKFNAISIK